MADECKLSEIHLVLKNSSHQDLSQRLGSLSRLLGLFRWELIFAIMGLLILAFMPVHFFFGQQDDSAHGRFFGSLFGQTAASAAWISLGPWSFRKRMPLAIAWFFAIQIALGIHLWLDAPKEPLTSFFTLAMCLFSEWILIQYFFWGLTCIFGLQLKRQTIAIRTSTPETKQHETPQITLNLFALALILLFLIPALTTEFYDFFDLNYCELWLPVYLVVAVTVSCLSVAFIWSSLAFRYFTPSLWSVLLLAGLVTLGESLLGDALAPKERHNFQVNFYILDAAWINILVLVITLGYCFLLRLKDYRFTYGKYATTISTQQQAYRFLLLIGGLFVGGFAIQAAGDQIVKHIEVSRLCRYLLIRIGTREGLVAQITISAIWAAFGPMRWYKRLPLAMIWFAALVSIYGLAYNHKYPDSIHLFVFVISGGLWLMLTFGFTLFSLLFGCRILHHQQRNQSFRFWSGKYSVRSLLILTAFVAVVLASIRSLVACIPKDSLSEIPLDEVIFTIDFVGTIGFILFPLFLAVLLPRYWIASTTTLIAIIALAVVGECVVVNPLLTRGPFEVNLLTMTSGKAATATWILLFALVLRWNGYRLTWPERKERRETATANSAA